MKTLKFPEYNISARLGDFASREVLILEVYSRMTTETLRAFIPQADAEQFAYALEVGDLYAVRIDCGPDLTVKSEITPTRGGVELYIDVPDGGEAYTFNPHQREEIAGIIRDVFRAG